MRSNETYVNESNCELNNGNYAIVVSAYVKHISL